MSDFPWTYDQYQRYSVVEEYLKGFYSEKEVTVLDVGGVSPANSGTSLWTPISRAFSGTAHVLDPIFLKGEHFTQGDGTNLPYKNETFDVITALDVIEHIPPKKREMFVAELLRVAKHSILLSAPFQSAPIEQAEEALFSQIKTLFDAEHQQLLEHRTLGLPEVVTIDQILENLASSSTSFPFGSLTNWLFFQSLKNVFLFGKNTKEILSLIDRWQASNNPSSEWEPPFARYFWIGTKDTEQDDITEGLNRLRENLQQKKERPPDFAEVLGFNNALTQTASSTKVSALVVSSGKGEHLTECLNHLSTQIVNFDFEIAVWDTRNDKNKRDILQSLFPGVRYFSQEEGDPLPTAFFRALDKLRGDYILLLSDDILLHQ
ncbi:MAG: class I SAM-dependent methyltransferase, partial [Candidatus Aminicenantes bacterium]|nr:class I SAM-dependent methyltransferase [Candidatus Aminicenantes bacterium]